MENYNALNITFYSLKLFMTVVEQKSFSKAAVILDIEQSTLSRRIAVLERDLNITLLHRKERPIRPTREGKILYDYWKNILTEFNTSLFSARAVGETEHNLAVAVVDSLTILHYIPVIRYNMLSHAKNCHLNFEYVVFSQWKDLLLNHKTDIAITLDFDVQPPEPIFECAKIYTYPKLVCMARTNPLCQKKSITYEDLKNSDFLAVNEKTSPKHISYIRNLCLEHGHFLPNIEKQVLNAHGLISAIETDHEVVICDHFLRDSNNPMIKSFELPDTTGSLCAVWRKDNTNPLIKLFVSEFEKFLSLLDD